MIKLTKRLQAIADMVKCGCVPVDVGTDHGYIPVYLIQNKICKTAACNDKLFGIADKRNDRIRELNEFRQSI